MDISATERRQAFSAWLRTGRWPVRETPDSVELKFNPYHDPRNGQFTFAPGGPRSLRQVIVSERRTARYAGADRPINKERTPTSGGDALTSGSVLSEQIFEPEGATSRLIQPAAAPEPARSGRGSNIRAFQDPMTLEQVFPGVRESPGGAIIALADNLFDLSGPSRQATAELTRNLSRNLIQQIKAIDPHYRFESLAPPQTLQGQINQLTRLRFDRAAAFLRVRSELRPLQVETVRFVQERTDEAYERGLRLLRAGNLRIRLSEQEALGNYVDKEVRRELRRQYRHHGIEAGGAGPVRVNRREYDSSGTELTYRRPDARVGKVAIDVTLAEKTLRTPQVRGFFATDFRPESVVIIRPSQLGGNHTYIISRPEGR